MTDNNTPPAAPSPPSNPQPKRANRWMLYVPLAIGALIFIGYSVFWKVGAGIMHDEVNQWIDGERQRGMIVEHGDIKIGGYPFFLRSVIETPTYQNPVEQWTWRAEKLLIDVSPLNPTRLILSPLGDQTIDLQTTDGPVLWNLKAETMRVSLAEDQYAVEIHNLLAGTKEATKTNPLSSLTLTKFLFNSSLNDDETSGLKKDLGSLAFEATGINLRLADSEAPIAIPLMIVALTGTGFEAINRKQMGETDIDAWKRGNGELVIDGIQIFIGDGSDTPPTQITAQGTLIIDAENYPAGKIDATIIDHQTLISLLRSHGAISAKDAQSADQILTSMAASMGGEIKAPIVMKKGRAKVGFIKIGKLPRLQ